MQKVRMQKALDASHPEFIMSWTFFCSWTIYVRTFVDQNCTDQNFPFFLLHLNDVPLVWHILITTTKKKNLSQLRNMVHAASIAPGKCKAETESKMLSSKAKLCMCCRPSYMYSVSSRDTLRDRRPSTVALLGNRDKGIETVYGGEKYFVLGALEQPRLNKTLLYRHDKPNEPTKEGPLSVVPFESPFTLITTVSWGNPPLVFLVSSYINPYCA